jgi:Thioredoxin-like domain
MDRWFAFTSASSPDAGGDPDHGNDYARDHHSGTCDQLPGWTFEDKRYPERCGALVLMDAAVWVVRLVVAAVFGLAAWGKVVDRAATRQAMRELGVPARFALVAGWALPCVELMVAVAVLWSARFRCGQVSTVRALRRQLEEIRASQPRTEGLPVGAAAPEFNLPGINGSRGTLDGLVEAGRPVALVFLHPDCGPCQGLARELFRWRKQTNGTLTLMPIGSGDLAANIAWARKFDLGEMLVQDGAEVAARYRLRGTPTAVLIDTRGRIAAPRPVAPSRSGNCSPTRQPADPTTQKKENNNEQGPHRQH